MHRSTALTHLDDHAAVRKPQLVQPGLRHRQKLQQDSSLGRRLGLECRSLYPERRGRPVVGRRVHPGEQSPLGGPQVRLGLCPKRERRPLLLCRYGSPPPIFHVGRIEPQELPRPPPSGDLHVQVLSQLPIHAPMLSCAAAPGCAAGPACPGPRRWAARPAGPARRPASAPPARKGKAAPPLACGFSRASTPHGAAAGLATGPHPHRQGARDRRRQAPHGRVAG